MNLSGKERHNKWLMVLSFFQSELRQADVVREGHLLEVLQNLVELTQRGTAPSARASVKSG